MNFIIRGNFINARKECLSIIGRNESLYIDSQKLDRESLSNLLSKIDYRPDNDVRFIVFEKADELSVVFQNKLLKTIEEGREYNNFIFLSNKYLLLDTIKSRCITKKVKELFLEDIEEYILKNKVTLNSSYVKVLYSAIYNRSDNIDFCVENIDYFVNIYNNLFVVTDYIKLFELNYSKKFDVSLIPNTLDLILYKLSICSVKTNKYMKVIKTIEESYKEVINNLNSFTFLICKINNMIFDNK